MILILLICSLAQVPASTDTLVARIEKTQLVISGKPVQRITRDSDGAVTQLNLIEMQLSPEEWKVVAGMDGLRSLTAYGSNISDADVAELARHAQLTGLNLTSTDITDAGVKSVGEMDSLKSVCLGNVRVTAEAIAELKVRRPRLSLGYFARK